MISTNALVSIERLFEESIRGNSVQGVEDACVVSFRAGVSLAGETKGHRLVVFNISSYLFRIIALFDFDTDTATVSHLAKVMHRNNERLTGKDLLDAFGEFSNIICGEVSRGLATKFRHIGMSTPFFLENTCMSYISILEPLQVRSMEVTINDDVYFRVILCICVDKENNLDFHINQTEHQTTPTGDLELF